VVGVSTPSVGTASGPGWEVWERTNVAVDDGGAAVLAHDPVPTYGDARPLAPVDDAVAVADVAVTPLGEVYAVGRDRETGVAGLYRHVADAASLWRVPCFTGADADRTPETVLTDPRALCATADSLFVADGDGSVHALSTHTYQHRWVAAGVATDPRALVTVEDDLLILDGGAAGEQARIAVVGPDGTTTRYDALDGAVDLTVDPSGRLLVLRTPAAGAVVERLADTPGGEVVSLGSVPLPSPRCLVSTAGGSVLVGGVGLGGGRTLVRYRPGTGTFEAVDGVDADWTALAGGQSLDRYGVTDGRLLVLDGTRQRAPHPATGRYEGQLRWRFDTGEPGTVWHGLSLDRTLPDPASGLTVRYRATDTPATESTLESLPVIGDVRAARLQRAGVTSYTDVSALTPERLSELVSSPASVVSTAQAQRAITAAQGRQPAWETLTPAGSADGLLSGAVGRYLDVQVDLVGSPDGSPRLQTLSATFDRDSYLASLPAVYRSDLGDDAFLDRFLAAFERVVADLETTLAADTAVLDPQGAPDEGVAWLGEWLGVDVEAEWPPAVARAMIASAPALQRARGTPAGLLALVATYLDTTDESRENGAKTAESTASDAWRWLLEYPDLDTIDADAARPAYERLLDGPASFRLLLHASLSPAGERALDRLVDGATPAHVAGEVVHLRDRSLLGDHTYLGVNAALTDPTFTVGTARLGTDTAIEEREPTAQATINSRLDDDARLS
jgi:phage tail-like protein